MDAKSQQPVRILLNYWEYGPERLKERLDQILHDGFQQVTSFVPWQAFESDISHRLLKFLQWVSDRGMTASLILTPEPAIHFAHSGVPKDLLANEDNHARGADGNEYFVNLPPRMHPLPSLLSPDLQKRYSGFIARFMGFLADAERAGVGKGTSVTLTGGFWKYYRSPTGTSLDRAPAHAGDESKPALSEYLRQINEAFAQPEFTDPDAAAAKRWKTRGYDSVNRKWFFQKAEDQFRAHAEQLLSRKLNTTGVEQVELYSPEIDPAVLYSSVFQAITDGKADFFRISSLLDSYATRASGAPGRRFAPFVHWTAVGGFRTLADSEKQFLLLKSLLLTATRGGGILVDEREWYSLSESFRKRVDLLSRQFSGGRLCLRTSAAYLAPHLWSPAGDPWTDLHKALGPEARVFASVETLMEERSARLAIVDPSVILRRDVITRLLEWARAGRVVALPESQFYTESARAELRTLLHKDGKSQSGGRASKVGVPHRAYDVGLGTIVFYDTAESARSDQQRSWKAFVGALLEKARISVSCSLSDGRLSAIPLARPAGDGRGMGLFVLNGTARPVTADILFPVSVRVSDLAMSLSDEPRPEGSGADSARRFSLEVPAGGILPLEVEGIGREDEERLEAAILADETRLGAEDAAASELPGFDPAAEIVWS